MHLQVFDFLGIILGRLFEPSQKFALLPTQEVCNASIGPKSAPWDRKLNYCLQRQSKSVCSSLVGRHIVDTHDACEPACFVRGLDEAEKHIPLFLYRQTLAARLNVTLIHHPLKVSCGIVEAAEARGSLRSVDPRPPRPWSCRDRENEEARSRVDAAACTSS